MRTVAIALLGLCATSCVMREDGVQQCEATIRDRLESPAFFKRLPDELGDLNAAHPNQDSGYTQRWVDINYETREQGADPVSHRHECVFALQDGKVGALIEAGDRDPRLLDYGRSARPGN